MPKRTRRCCSDAIWGDSIKIAVCIKQVPARDWQPRLNDDHTWIREQDVAYETNEPDAYALEEALRLKEKHGGEVVVCSAGPARVAQVLREALARGADRAIHVESEALARADAFVVADAEGNMIAFTQTLSTWGGNYYVSKGLGFLYNDHFRGGRGGTGYGSMLPLMRSSTTSVPTLVFAPSSGEAGRSGVPGYAPRLAVGCAGNAWIPASVYSIILNVVDGDMPAQRAIEAPRLLIGGGEGGRSRVQIEDRLPRPLLADLEARGHSFSKVGRKGEVKYGYAALAVVNTAKATVQGGADPRRSHATAAPGK